MVPEELRESLADNQASSTMVPEELTGSLAEDTSGTLAINLTYSLGMWSIGSAEHAKGNCKPCGFLWKKGCQKGQNCGFCHLCPADEVKKRKREKIAAKQRAEELLWECGEDEGLRECREDEGCGLHQTPRILPPLPK